MKGIATNVVCDGDKDLFENTISTAKMTTKGHRNCFPFQMTHFINRIEKYQFRLKPRYYDESEKRKSDF